MSKYIVQTSIPKPNPNPSQTPTHHTYLTSILEPYNWIDPRQERSKQIWKKKKIPKNLDTYLAMTLIATRSPVVLDLPFRTLAKLPLYPKQIKVKRGSWNLLANNRFNFVVGLDIGRVDAVGGRLTLRGCCFNHQSINQI